MILLAIASCLLFFVTYFTGIYTGCFLKKFLSIDFTANFFETFLFGLMACYWRYGEIEMRRAQIEDGFRSKNNEVKLFFPFVDVK
jgi:hypothetical protein